MITQHLSEAIIQQYAMDPSVCDSSVGRHILGCEHCKARASNYQLLFSEIKDMPKPVFEFDLPGMVLEKLPARAPRFSWFTFAVAVFSIACMALAGYIFSDYLINLFQGISMILLCLIVVSVLVILLFQSIDIYKNYQRKIDRLNFY